MRLTDELALPVFQGPTTGNINDWNGVDSLCERGKKEGRKAERKIREGIQKKNNKEWKAK